MHKEGDGGGGGGGGAEEEEEEGGGGGDGLFGCNYDTQKFSIFLFHSSVNDLNNEYCKWPNSIENWRNSYH
jgi:hypothetical protein